MEKIPKISGVWWGSCCETCRNIPQKIPLKKFTMKTFLTRHTEQKMNFSFKDLFSKCDQIHRKLRILSHLLMKSLKEKFIFCAVTDAFRRSLQQLLLKEIFNEVAIYSQFIFVWRYNTYISLEIIKSSSGWFWRYNLFLLYRQYRRKFSTRMHRRNHSPNMFFSYGVKK